MKEPLKSEEEIFTETAPLSAAERRAYLERACGSDAALRARIEALLKSHDEAGSLLDVAPGGVVRTSLAGPPPDEKPGTLIGRYKLLQKIGEGGCGVVYMAEQEEPVRRRVALKVIKLGMDTREVVARFEAERQALAMMDHPNIARVLDGGATAAGRPYFVMELVRGVPITKYCDENNLPTSARLELFMQVCQAVQHAHQKGIIHRDLKPSNILVTVNDGVSVPKVIDFGIAKATQGRLTDHTLFTAFEQFIGTPAYMSPEQAELTSLDVDTRSDIYSLGVLLYELLTGQTPFDARSLLQAGLDEIRRVIREVEPPRPSARLSTLTDADRVTVAKLRSTAPMQLSTLLHGDLDWIVMRCLEKDRRRRYETANGLAMDLQRHLSHEPVTARPPSVIYRFNKMVRRNRLAFTAGALVAVALVAGLIFSTWALMRERAASQRAEAARAQAERLTSYLLTDVRPKFEQLGQSPLLEQLARETLRYYDQLPSELRETSSARDRAIAFETLATAYAARGEYKGTRDALAEALALRKRALEAAPADVDTAAAVIADDWWSYWYAWTFENPAAGHGGRWSEAARPRLEGLIHQARELRAAHPDNTDVTVCLADMLDRLAWLCVINENNRKQAVVHFREAVDLTRDALAQKPNDNSLRLKHGWSLSHLSGIDAIAGGTTIQDYEKAQAFADSAAAANPGNVAFLALSAVTAHRGLHIVPNRSHEQKKDAELVVRERLHILTQLDPTNLEWQRRFVAAHEEEAWFYLANAQDEKARGAFEKFRALLEPIAAATNEQAKLHLVIAQLGWLAAKAGDKGSAQRHLREAQAVYHAHIASLPEGSLKQALAQLDSLEREAITIEAIGDWPQLEAAANARILIATRALGLEGNNVDLVRRRADARTHLGRALKNQGRMSEAVPMLENLLADYRDIPLGSNSETDREWHIANTKETLADALIETGETRRAREFLEEVVAFSESDLARQPRLGGPQAALARTALKLAAILDVTKPEEAARRKSLLDRVSRLTAENPQLVHEREMLQKAEALRATSQSTPVKP